MYAFPVYRLLTIRDSASQHADPYLSYIKYILWYAGEQASIMNVIKYSWT